MVAGKIKKILSLHQVSTSETFNENLLSIKVICAEFNVLAASVWLPNKKRWFKLNNGLQFFKSREMIELAMKCLYYVNLPLGICVIQRGSGGECLVQSIGKVKRGKLPNRMLEEFLAFNQLQRDDERLTFGADVEGLMHDKKRNKYITASSLFKGNDRLGYDNAIIVKENKTKNHILEIRPLPASNGKELYDHLVAEYNNLQKVAHRYNLTIVGGANPLRKVMLGGHLHIGNQKATYKIVRAIDLYFGIPMSIIEKSNAVQRRSNYGRLGSIRMNKYNGFEYRSLSSWIEHIPTMKPVFLWFSLLLNHHHLFDAEPFSKQLLKGYYMQDNKILTTEIKALHMKALSRLHRPSHQHIANDFFTWVLERSVSSNKEFRGNML